jgi:hypothetical protein
MTDEQAANASPSELIEAGVGLIARGMFRRGDKSGENDPQSAYKDGMSAVAVVRDMAFGFLKSANAAKR